MKFLLVILLLTFNFAFADETAYSNYVSKQIDRANELVSNKDHIVGVELIISGRSNSLASSFGHALLRFVYKDALKTDESIESFGILLEEETVSIWKAATSKYSFIPEVMTLQEVWNRYYEKENRSLKKYVLDLSPEQLNKFIDVAFFYLQSPEQLNAYNVIRNNCMVVISKFLIEAGLTQKQKQVVFPANAHKWLKKNKLTSLPEIVMANPKKTAK